MSDGTDRTSVRNNELRAECQSISLLIRISRLGIIVSILLRPNVSKAIRYRFPLILV